MLDLKAQALAQSAQLVAQRALLRTMSMALQASKPPSVPSTPPPSFDAIYVDQYREQLKHLLLQEKDKGLAARLTELLESPHLDFQLKWD